MEGDTEQTKKITSEQRESMLDFMKKHPSLATGKFTAPDGAKHEQRLLNELANLLNSMANGVSKSPDKWLKSWQDWRSDTKSKAALIKREIKKTGGGRVSAKAKSLSALEEQLLSFLGPSVVYGHAEVLDPLDEVKSGTANEDGVTAVEASTVQVVEEYILLPLEGPLHSPPPKSPTPSGSSDIAQIEESVSSSSRKSTPLVGSERVQQISEEDEEPGKTKRTKRQKGSSGSEAVTADEETAKLLKLSESQVDLARESLELKKRQTSAFESAAVAFCGAMKAMECYFNSKSGEPL